MDKKKVIFSLFFLLFSIVVYKNWLISKEIIGGDWPYFYSEELKELSFFPPSWSPVHGGGLGGPIIAYYLDQYLYFTGHIFFNILHTPWPIVYKIFWFGLFLVLSAVNSAYFLKKAISFIPYWLRNIGILIFTVNTYILMVVGGGQIGIALAYSMVPLVLALFMFSVDQSLDQLKSKLRSSLLSGLILSIQIMFDPRIAYMTFIVVLLYVIFRQVRKFNITTILTFLKQDFVYIILVPAAVALLLHAYWLFPIFILRSTSIPEGLLSTSGFQFFSFADFSHALSLLHPNWPENIFGKTYFMMPEFILLPILAYSSLLFISNIKNQISKIHIKNQKDSNNLAIKQFSNKTIIFFALIGLLGAFLAKGVNSPFGEVNSWLFQHIPGMNLFRDPTKFYLLIVLSYSVLIPFSIYSIYNWFNSQFKIQNSKTQFKIQNYLPNLFLIFTICYLIFLLRPALLGQLTGTFKSHTVPKEYRELKDFIISQPNFFRMLWLPKQQRFTYVSKIHPSIEAGVLFSATNSAALIEWLKKDDMKEYIENLSVKYVIIPYDSLGEIFLEDRRYSQNKRAAVNKGLDSIQWLKKVYNKNLTIYETEQFKDHFWMEGEGEVSYTSSSPIKYVVAISSQRAQMLYFSENYNSSWVAKIGGNIIPANQTEDGLIRFSVPKGSHTVEVYYGNEIYYLYGRIISGITLLLLLSLLLVLKSKDYEKPFA